MFSQGASKRLGLVALAAVFSYGLGYDHAAPAAASVGVPPAQAASMVAGDAPKAVVFAPPKPDPTPAAVPAQAPAPAVPAPATDVISLGRQMNAARFGDGQWTYLYRLWERESGWNPAAVNRRSGACGIPQALPCSKIPDMSPAGQIAWGLDYIARRYGSPLHAWEHSLSFGYY